MDTDIESRFEWPVAIGGYEWVETKWGTVLMPKKSQPGPPRRYNPMGKGNEDLFRKFANLSTARKASKDILRFANEYGLLGPPVTRWFPSWDSSPEPEELFAYPGHGQRAVYLRPGKPPPSRFGDPLGVWDEAVDEDELGATALVYLRRQQSLSETITRMRRALELSIVLREFVREGRPTDYSTTLGINDVCNWVDQGLALTTAPQLKWSKAISDFQLIQGPRSLSGALWMQLARSLSPSKSYRECPVCGKLMEISTGPGIGARADAQFCSDKCRSKDYRERKKRARQLADRGFKLSRIAKELRSNNATVRGWLKAKK